MFLRVINFMTANAADFESISFVADAVSVLQTETEALGALGAAKITATAASKNSTSSRGDARQDLRDDLEYVAAVWRSMPDETPGMQSKFRLSRGNNDQNLIAAAHSFANDADDPPTQALLTARGLPTEFFTALRAKADAFSQAIANAESKHGERVGTNAAFAERVRRGRRQVDKLAPTVKHFYRGNTQKLAEWLVASHVERAPKRAKKDPPPTVAPTQPTEPDE